MSFRISTAPSRSCMLAGWGRVGGLAVRVDHDLLLAALHLLAGVLARVLLSSVFASLADPRSEAALSSVEQASDLVALQTTLEVTLEPYGLQHIVYHALRIPAVSISQTTLVRTYLHA